MDRVESIIEQIKALPADEQVRVADFMRGLATANREGSEIKYVDRDKARVIADRIFTEYAELFRKLAE